MKVFAFTCVMAASLLAGCGTTAQKNSTATTAPAPTTAAATELVAPPPQALQPVRVPADSAKKVVLKMTGPKTTVEAKDWASFKDEWRATFADHAKQSGIAFSMLEGDTRPTPEAGTLLTVYVNDYRQVGIGARIFFGVMTGSAYIDATGTFTDLNNGQRFGEQAYNTSTSAWSGVFGKMTPHQVDAIATEVFSGLKVR
jgi:hypothetical protein